METQNEPLQRYAITRLRHWLDFFRKHFCTSELENTDTRKFDNSKTTRHLEFNTESNTNCVMLYSVFSLKKNKNKGGFLANIYYTMHMVV